jgi:hypothetical protein
MSCSQIFISLRNRIRHLYLVIMQKRMKIMLYIIHLASSFRYFTTNPSKSDLIFFFSRHSMFSFIFILNDLPVFSRLLAFNFQEKSVMKIFYFKLRRQKKIRQRKSFKEIHKSNKYRCGI